MTNDCLRQSANRSRLDLISIGEADIMLVAGVGHSQVRAYPTAAAQLGPEPLGHRVEDLLSELNDLF